ncbi:MAG: hypothetical protein ACRBDL_02120 [Alphaproteobacteria bacterium]
MSDKEFKTERVTFMASERLLKEIEDYQFENRIQGQSEAIRQLIEVGLEKSK